MFEKLRYASTFTTLAVVFLVIGSVLLPIKFPQKFFNFDERMLPLGIEDRWAIYRWQELVVIGIRIGVYVVLVLFMYYVLLLMDGLS